MNHLLVAVFLALPLFQPLQVGASAEAQTTELGTPKKKPKKAKSKKKVKKKKKKVKSKKGPKPTPKAPKPSPKIAR